MLFILQFAFWNFTTKSLFWHRKLGQKCITSLRRSLHCFRFMSLLRLDCMSSCNIIPSNIETWLWKSISYSELRSDRLNDRRGVSPATPEQIWCGSIYWQVLVTGSRTRNIRIELSRAPPNTARKCNFQIFIELHVSLNWCACHAKNS